MGFPNRYFCDSWAVGLWRTNHADRHDRNGLGDRSARFRGCPVAARRQGPRRPQISRSPALFHGPQRHLARFPARVRQLEQRVEALLAVEQVRRLRSVLRGTRRDERDSAACSNVQFDRGARPCFGGGRKGGQKNQALGRSRGGFSTKIHLKTDFDGLPIAFLLTGGEASDSRQFETLLDIGPDIAPRAALADKGYDAKSNRDAARERGICPAIPYRSTIKDKPASSRNCSTRDGRASNRRSAKSNASSALPCAARRQPETTVHSSPSSAPSS